MTQATIATRAPLSTVMAVDTAEDTVSGVSWAAVLAGAFVAAAFSLALVALGAGIGLVSVSTLVEQQPLGDHLHRACGGMVHRRPALRVGGRGLYRGATANPMGACAYR